MRLLLITTITSEGITILISPLLRSILFRDVGSLKAIIILPKENDTYNMFLSMNERMLKHETEKLTELIDEYKALELIREPLGEHISKDIDIEYAINEIEKETGVTAETSKFLISKYKINKLFTLNTDTTEIDNKIKELTNNLNNLNDFVLEQYNGLT